MSRIFLYLGTLAIVVLLSNARAEAVILVDPGVVGGPGALSFQATVAELEAGEDILFTGLKHVELFGDSLLMSISLTMLGPPFGILNRDKSGEINYWYSDMDANQIGNTGAGTWDTIFEDGINVGNISPIPNPSAPDPFIVHDLHIQFFGLGAAVDPDSTLIGVNVSWPGGSEVGLWSAPVPEPASLIVWSLLGTVAITVGWRRRRKHA